MRTDITGQVGRNPNSAPGLVAPGWNQLGEQDPNNPIYFPSSCGPGSYGGAITGSVKGFKQMVKALWPTRK